MRICSIDTTTFSVVWFFRKIFYNNTQGGAMRFIILVVLLSFPIIGSALILPLSETENRTERLNWRLICSSKEGVVKVLNYYKTAKQFTGEPHGKFVKMKKMKKAGCSFESQHIWNTPYSHQIFQNNHGLIFPVYTGSVNGDFRRKHIVEIVLSSQDWSPSNDCAQWGITRYSSCIVPKSCEALDKFMGFNNWINPGYAAMPRQCTEERN